MSTKTTSGSVYERLHKAIKRHSGMDDDQLIDAGNHGADGGWPGFTYYDEAIAFFKKNRAAIVELVDEQAESMGETALDMVAGFQCLGGQRRHSDRSEHERRKIWTEYYPSVSRCLYGGRITEGDRDVANALAWFALEEIGRWLESEKENR